MDTSRLAAGSEFALPVPPTRAGRLGTADMELQNLNMMIFMKNKTANAHFVDVICYTILILALITTTILVKLEEFCAGCVTW